MRAGLASPTRAILFVGIGAAVSLTYIWFAARAYRADRAASFIDQPHLERAMQLEPANSDYPYRLGMYAFRFQQDTKLAESSFRRAVSLNPYRTRYWLGLAAVYVSEGDMDKQRAAIESAVEAEPTNPETTAEAGNLYLVEGDIPRALKMFRVTLASEQYNEQNIFDVCWRATRDADLLLADALPEKAIVRLRFIQYLTLRKETDAAAKVWNAVMSGREAVSAHDAMPYVDYLLAQGAIPQAHRAWQQLLSRDSELKGYVRPGTLVVNDRFDEPLLNAGFDWRVTPNPAVTLNLDSLEFHERGRSLKMVFAGDPFQDAGISQAIPVEPNRTYSFGAWSKTEEIYSAAGPRFAIDDAVSGQRLMMTKELVGTSPWQKVDGEFQTGPTTVAVRLHVVQSSADHVKGSMWLDGVDIALKQD